MSIKLEDLGKRYGNFWAVQELNLQVAPGQILGFLGPNGAGKSTTLRMLAGRLPSTTGQAWLAGYAVGTHAHQAQAQLGYLPEHNPLYLDLYVREHLELMGRLMGLRGPTLQQRIRLWAERVGLGPQAHQKVRALSKGYRQRLGLALALLHEPPVVVLDEPTTGLDPNQVLEIRELVRQIGQQCTVVFSSHQLAEVEAVATDIAIIHKSRLRVQLSRREWQEAGAGRTYQLTFLKPWPALPQLPDALAALGQATLLPDATDARRALLRMTSPPPSDDALRSAWAAWAAEQGNPVTDMQAGRTSLEALFRQHTQA